MDLTPDDARFRDAEPSAHGEPSPERLIPDGHARAERAGQRPSRGQACWNIEMLESPLMDQGIAYTLCDASPSHSGNTSPGLIEFTLPTRIYRDVDGNPAVRVRLTVNDGRLVITAPGVYARGSLIGTTDPPPDREKRFQVLRLGDKGQMQIDLVMAANGAVTAVLRMETILRPFNRNDIVQIAEQFAGGIDLVELMIRESRLRRE
jgi:hypothetical protein